MPYLIKVANNIVWQRINMEFETIIPRIAKKEFETIENGEKIWINTTTKLVPKIIYDISKRLAQIDLIKYVKISNDTILASSEIKGKRVLIPVIEQEHETAIGINLAFYLEHKMMDFCVINSPIKGYGSKMVDSVLTDFPDDWNATVIFDYSDGFWDKMKSIYDKINWVDI
jgi:hypothetical protein